ncbi:DUF4926 domain-containing protein [Silvimonas iriomotensis]|uniref:DUF4926 domain-containing protein n=1 Tax=Silvimonas iriomotensis TaxID=449662 RepID=A0ABQ2PAF3_9NEIS|nr:hypothetical protein GCM10010970_23560 [Silvimonas iriomotensis]
MGPYDVVESLVDLPTEGVKRGQSGAIVDVLDAETFIVEFVDREGVTTALADMKVSMLRLLRSHPPGKGE